MAAPPAQGPPAAPVVLSPASRPAHAAVQRVPPEGEYRTSLIQHGNYKMRVAQAGGKPSGDALMELLGLRRRRGRLARLGKKEFEVDEQPEVEFNRYPAVDAPDAPAVGRWECVQRRTDIDPADLPVELNSADIVDRCDVTPEGAIAVLGFFDASGMVEKATEQQTGPRDTNKVAAYYADAVERKKRTLLKKRQDGKGKQGGVRGSGTQEEDESEDVGLLSAMIESEAFGKRDPQKDNGVEDSYIVNACENGEQLSVVDTVKVVRQYMTRSIVNVAHTKDAVIVTTDHADINSNLCDGIRAVGQTDNDFALDERVPLVDVWRRGDPTALCTHRLELYYREDPRAKSEAMTALLSSLGSQFDDDDDGDDDTASRDDASDAPLVERQPTRVVGVLIGGAVESAMYDLFPFVENNWPFFIIEGSGGYADRLAKTIHRVEAKMGGTASKDDYQAILSGVDTAMAKILTQGTYVLVKKGTLPEEFERLLKMRVAGEDILHGAWRQYATWNHFGEINKRKYHAHMRYILVLGVVTTFCAIFKTFLGIVAPEQVDGRNENGTLEWAGGSSAFIPNLNAWLTIVLILLPLTISLVQGIANTFNAGAMWVSLKYCAEGLLSEIYMYRTECGEYSRQEVARKAREKRRLQKLEKRKGLTDRDAGNEDKEKLEEHEKEVQYSTRSELLHLKLVEFTNELSAAEMSEATLPDWKGVIPPAHITAGGDDGFSDLTAERYMQLRLRHKIAHYNKDAERYNNSKGRIQMIIYAVGGLGTTIAAIATLEDLRQYNLGAWVAFTTSIGNALTRYLDYTKMEWLHNKYNSVMRELESIEARWESLGADGAKSATTNTLVKDTEQRITTEIQEFKQQLKIAVAAAAKAADAQAEEQAAITKQLKSGQQSDVEKKFEATKIGAIDAEMIEAAIRNPVSAEARELLGVIERVDDEIGVSDAVIAKVEESAAQVVPGGFPVKENLDQLRGLIDAAGNFIDDVQQGEQMMMEKFIVKDVLKVISDPRKRTEFFANAETITKGHGVWQMGYADMKDILLKSGRQFDALLKQPPRMQLTALVSLCSEELTGRFDEALETIGCSALEFVEKRDQLNDLLAEAHKLSTLPPETAVKHLLATCPMMRKKLGDMPEIRVRSLHMRVTSLFGEKNLLQEMYQSFLEKQADMDLEYAFQSCLRSEKAQVLAKVRDTAERYPLNLLDKNEILDMYPPQMQALLKEKSHAALVAGLQRLKHGSTSMRSMKSWLLRDAQRGVRGLLNQAARDATRVATVVATAAVQEATAVAAGAAGAAVGTLVAESQAERQRVIDSLTESSSFIEQMAFAAETISQTDLNTLSPAMILKRLSNECNQELTDAVQQANAGDHVRRLLSGLRAEMANTYVGSLFDQLASEVLTFNTDDLLSWEERELLVSRMNDIANMNIEELSDGELRAQLVHRVLIQKCTALDTVQLRELLRRLQLLVTSTFRSGLFEKAVQRAVQRSACVQKKAVVSELRAWRDDVRNRFVDVVMKAPTHLISPEGRATLGEWKTVLVSDEHVARAIDSLLRRDERTVCELVAMARSLAGECSTLEFFSSVSRDLQIKRMRDHFNAVFMFPFVREEFIRLMTSCVKRGLSRTMIKTVINERLKLETDELTRTLKRAFGKKEDLLNILHYLVGELELTAGTRMFTRLAEDISAFNIRELLPDTELRPMLFALVLRLKWSGQLTHLLALTAADNVKKTVIAMLREHVDDASKEYTRLEKAFRQFQDDQLLALLDAAGRVLSQSFVGRFFSRMEWQRVGGEASGVGEDEDDASGFHIELSVAFPKLSEREALRFVRDEAMVVVRNHVKMTASQLDFDATFVVGTTEQRRERINSLIRDNEKAVVLATLSDEELTYFKEFMALQQTFRAMPLKMMVPGLNSRKMDNRQQQHDQQSGRPQGAHDEFGFSTDFSLFDVAAATSPRSEAAGGGPRPPPLE